MKFTWIGGPSFLLQLGPFRVVGDPVLVDQFELEGAAVTRAGACPDVDLGGADLVLVTSLRADHFDAAAIAACRASRALLPGGGTESAAPAGIEGARDFAHGESIRIERDGAALVVHSVAAGPPAGAATDNGYFLKLEHGGRPFTAYVTGDTLFSEATREIQRTHGYSNLLVLHLGAERTRGRICSADAKEAMQIVYRMQPNAIAAVHHSTFSHYTEPIAPFLEKISLTIYEKRLRVLREGGSFEKVIAPGD
jgi:L-ascorbate metabolism protein UlaG (beta-lactamase superfamily)